MKTMLLSAYLQNLSAMLMTPEFAKCEHYDYTDLALPAFLNMLAENEIVKELTCGAVDIDLTVTDSFVGNLYSLHRHWLYTHNIHDENYYAMSRPFSTAWVFRPYEKPIGPRNAGQLLDSAVKNARKGSKSNKVYVMNFLYKVIRGFIELDSAEEFRYVTLYDAYLEAVHDNTSKHPYYYYENYIEEASKYEVKKINAGIFAVIDNRFGEERERQKKAEAANAAEAES